MIDAAQKLIKRSLIGLLTLIFTSTLVLTYGENLAQAQEPVNTRFSAKVLVAFCTSRRGAPYDDGVCAGYITGVADMMAAEPSMAGKLCLPRDVSSSDFAKMARRYLAKRPELEQAPAAGMVREALLAAFPC
jgi:hypothetical protein